MQKKILIILIMLSILSSINPTTGEDTIIYDQDYSLNAHEYTTYEIDVSAAPAYVHIELKSNGNLQVLILNNTEAQKWIGGETAWGHIYHNVTNFDLYHTFDEIDTWYLILYNRYTAINSRSGHITITGVDEQPATGVMFDQTYTVGPKAYTSYAFWVYDSPTILHIEMNSSGKLQLAILNETEAMKWINGELAWGHFYDNITNLDLYHTITEYDIWYIMVYNRYSEISSRSGHLTVTKVSERPATGALFDQDFTIEPNEYTDYAFWVYDSPTTLHIEINADGNLQLAVLNKTEAMKWMSGEMAWGYYYDNVTNLDLYRVLSEYDTWYIILYNLYSDISSHSGHITVTKVNNWPTTSIMFDQDYTIEPKSQTNYAFWVYDSPTTLHIELSSDRELQLVILNETEAMKWMNGEMAWGYFYSEITNLDLYHAIEEYDTWYVILYNRYSDIFSCTGHITIAKVDNWPPTGVMFDQDYQMAPRESTSYVFWNYDSPTILNIELTTDDNLWLFIFNETEALKWMKGESAQGYNYHVVDSLDIHFIFTEYNVWYIILYHIGSPQNTVSGHITITKVEDFVGPSIDQPADITYEEGTLALRTITWNPIDDNPASYIIYWNGVERVSNPWDGSSISIDVSGLPSGEYNYTLLVIDGHGNQASDMVVVTVEAAVIPTSEPDMTSITTMPPETSSVSPEDATSSTTISETAGAGPTPTVTSGFTFITFWFLGLSYMLLKAKRKKKS